MITFPNAKINLGLRVLRKRSDGFHDIRSLFLPVPLCDALEVIPADDNGPLLEVLGHALDVPPEKNLVWKTYGHMRSVFQLPDYHIILYKKIPSGGGLGGGSADVGFLIRMLNQLGQLGLTAAEMEAIALEIGSDCPFFIQNRPSLVSGRGEKLEGRSSWRFKAYTVLLFSDQSVSTAEAYAGITPYETGPDLRQVLDRQALWRSQLVNDFGKVVYRQHPGLADNIEKMYRCGAFYASLTGTGGAQYAFFETPPQLPEEVRSRIIWQGWLSFP